MSGYVDMSLRDYAKLNRLKQKKEKPDVYTPGQQGACRVCYRCNTMLKNLYNDKTLSEKQKKQSFDRCISVCEKCKQKEINVNFLNDKGAKKINSLEEYNDKILHPALMKGSHREDTIHKSPGPKDKRERETNSFMNSLFPKEGCISKCSRCQEYLKKNKSTDFLFSTTKNELRINMANFLHKNKKDIDKCISICEECQKEDADDLRKQGRSILDALKNDRVNIDRVQPNLNNQKPKKSWLTKFWSKGKKEDYSYNP
jgi:hypothetical protein